MEKLQQGCMSHSSMCKQTIVLIHAYHAFASSMK